MLSKKPFIKGNTFRISYKNQWIHIPTEHISHREMNILNLLKEEAQTDSFPISQSEWFHFLDGSLEHPPTTDIPVRLIQMVLEKINTDFAYSTWVDAVGHIFESVLDVFFVSEDTCLIIQKHTSKALKQKELFGMLKTLEDDFSIRANAYIGQFWESDPHLKTIFREERHIFQEEYRHLDYRMNSLSDVALRYFTKDAVSHSTLMLSLKTSIEKQPEWKELIFALWENQGNVTVAAKQLFIHRNTLQYRMDRYYDSTGLSLKNMNDLLLSFLIIS